MYINHLFLGLLLTAGFSLAAWLEPWFQGWSGSRTKSADLLNVALGDSRRLFAKHAYVKADAYFHRGYYPSIYDSQERERESHLAAEARDKSHSGEGGDLGQPLDWIAGFGRHFYPSSHGHFGESQPGRDAQAAQGEDRELLPWFRLAASLDPNQTETYLVGAFWMRNRLGKSEEAEHFLREGLRANPGDSELLFELGQIYFECRQDPERARNVWELALRNCETRQWDDADKGRFLQEQILGRLARLEEAQKNYHRSLEYLQRLRECSPNKGSIDKWIEEVRLKIRGQK